jgi:hypothetical protein
MVAGDELEQAVQQVEAAMDVADGVATPRRPRQRDLC